MPSKKMSKPYIVQMGPLRKEMAECYKSLRSDECAITLIRSNQQINAISNAQMKEQIRLFKLVGARARKSNVREVTLGDKKGYLVVIQSPEKFEDTDSICPFSTALGLLVSGIGYLVKDRKALDDIINAIGVEGATPNPLFS